MLCILFLKVAIEVDDEALILKSLSIIGHALRIERRLRPAGLQILKLLAIPYIKYEMFLIACHLKAAVSDALPEVVVLAGFVVFERNIANGSFEVTRHFVEAIHNS